MIAPGLQEPAKKALATLDREWDGLAAHRRYPMISLDNNPAERAIRRPVVTRKNAYGSRNEDAAHLAARIWTVTATAEMAGLNVLTYLMPTSTPAAATTASPSPARTWNSSCPGTQTPPTCALGHGHRRPADTETAQLRRVHPNQLHRPSSCPITGLPNTYGQRVPIGCSA
jgi:hypothetical protein